MWKNEELMYMRTSIYSIGHGHKTQEEFIDELQYFHIQYLIDVRATPFSKWSPQFNQGVIEQWLKAAGIIYGYMGNSIGGRPQDDTCYDEEGFFDYRKMAEVPAFKEGLKRLLNANSQGLYVAVMCTESDPLQCHRSKLIGRELYFGQGINMPHIIGVGKTISQTQIMTELTKGDWLPGGNLFGRCEPPYFKSRKAYKDLMPETVDYYD